MNRYIISLDQGTTSSRCIIFDRDGNAISSAQREFPQYYPQEGWVEHNAEEIWDSQLLVLREALKKGGLTPSDIAAVGITNQRETVIVWDRETGKPIAGAIVWQCRRTAEFCQTLRDEGREKQIREKTGLLLDAYFSASKLKWLLDKYDPERKGAKSGRLLFGTVDSWLIYNLTGGRVHATDVTNASRTMLFNINTMRWDEELLDLFGVPEAMLPEVKPSSGFFGMLDKSLVGGEIPIYGVAGDQQAALFGQCCYSGGDVKNTYGTGCFMLMNIGEKPVLPKNRMLTTVAWKIGDKTTYAIEGSVFVAGAAIQWLRDELGIIKSAEETEELAKSVADTGGVYFVPAFVGLGAPHWNPNARGMITGITRGTGRAEIVRAALESLAYQTRDILHEMSKASGLSLLSLRVDGGASANNFLMQFQADILGVNVLRPKAVETTALGAAYLAGLASGFWKDIEEIEANAVLGKMFVPNMDKDERKRKLSGWSKAIKRVKLQ